MFEVLQQLPLTSLRALASSLQEGTLSVGITRSAVTQIAGAQAVGVCTCLDELARKGMTPQHIALLVDAVAEMQHSAADPTLLFQLVLSGPEVPGVPTRDTAATMQTLIEQANDQVLLIGYAVHNARRIFERLASKMAGNPSLKVVFCLEIQRKFGDTSLSSEIVRRFATDFRKKHWPWPQLPQLFYDPRSLAESAEEHSSLHAKCVVVDRRVALVTSANFTEAAQLRNIEAGIVVKYQPFVEQLANYFEGLLSSGQLVCCPLG